MSVVNKCRWPSRLLLLRSLFINPFRQTLVDDSKNKEAAVQTSNGYFAQNKDNKLFKQIKSRILAGGAITVADYMKEVLTNPTAGYYMNKDVFGSQGDFTTSPEVSQMFGEMVAVWFVNEWAKCGKPAPLQIVELGPGRGTLMADILRVFSKLNIIEPSKLSVSLVEVSPHLSQIQEKKLCNTRTKQIEESDNSHHYKEAQTVHGSPVRWYRNLSNVPRSFSLFLAHEFFDALPVHKLVIDEQGHCHEVLVDLSHDESTLRYVMSRNRTPASIYRQKEDPRKSLEVSPQSIVIVQEMAARINQDGGIGMIVDYGHEGEKCDTFRAFKNHKLHDPLVEPGTADLTADVDFSALKWAARNPARTGKPSLIYGTVDQRTFLTKMGIDVRLEKLIAASQNESVIRDLKSAHQMLTDANEMGGKFKVMSLFPVGMEKILAKYPPHGFS